MNYITQINGFFDALLINPLSANAVALYVTLLHLNNRAKWIKEFTCANVTVQSLSGLSRSALDRARNELKQKGYIRYTKGAGNQSGKYLIVRFDTQIGTQSNTQIETQTGTQDSTQMRHNPGTLNKQNKTKQNNDLTYQQIVDMFNKTCVSFPQCTKLSDKRKQAIRARINQGYTLDDFKRLFDLAEASNFLKGCNSRNWIASFDWLIRDANMAKVLDGNYANREAPTSTPSIQQRKSFAELAMERSEEQ